MKIIDAQVHIWKNGEPGGHHRQIPRYTAEDLIDEMNEAGVDGAVLHPPSWYSRSNEMAIAAFQKHPEHSARLAGFRWMSRRNANALRSGNNYTWVSEKSGYTRPGLVWRRAQNQKDTRISERSGYTWNGWAPLVVDPRRAGDPPCQQQ